MSELLIIKPTKNRKVGTVEQNGKKLVDIITGLSATIPTRFCIQH